MFDAIKGIKVLDLTRLTPGGYATKLMAEMGAEVVKIEDTGNGDYMRIVGPMYDDASIWYYAVNVSKKSACLNLKTPEGVDIFKTLVKHYDVLIEGFRPGVMARLGLEYQTLAEINPRLVYCSLTGFGQDGPYNKQPGHDINYMAIAGALGLTGLKNGPVIPPGLQVADMGGAIMAVVGILAAYICALRTGKGKYVDISMTDTALSLLPLEMAEYLATGNTPDAGQSYFNGGEACYAVYPTKDGRHVCMGNREDKFWKTFCRVAERPDLEALQFSTEESAFQKIREFFETKTLDEITALFDAADTCITPVLKLDEVPDHPQISAREMIVNNAAETGSPPFMACPIRSSGKNEHVYQPAPRQGEHTREVLTTAGYSKSFIERAIRDGVAK